jgi:AcrR family transcriptional regulator
LRASPIASSFVDPYLEHLFNIRQGVFMKIRQATDTKRKRAASKRSLETKSRVFDAAEKVFADWGYDGATIRDIAAEAGEPVGTIHHHGGGKEALFYQTVARRAEILSNARLTALEQARSGDGLRIEQVLDALIRPFVDLTMENPRWRSYARLVAYVSADDRWRAISAECFDPTAQIFIGEIQKCLPHAKRQHIAEGFVFSVSAMLALLTSEQRISALGGKGATQNTQVDHLIRFCVAGFNAEL